MSSELTDWKERGEPLTQHDNGWLIFIKEVCSREAAEGQTHVSMGRPGSEGRHVPTAAVYAA